MPAYTFGTNDPALAQRIMDLMNGGSPQAQATLPLPPPAATVIANAVPPAAPPAPPAPVAPPPAAPAAPAAPPPAAPAAPAHGPAPEGWTIDHVRGALTTMAQNPAKGPAAVGALLAKYTGGAPDLKLVDPAQWPNLYSEATAG